MNRSELFGELKNWLEAEQVSHVSDGGEASFQVRANIDNGIFLVHLLCEDSPATLHVFCPLPMKVPAGKIVPTSLWLHDLNLRLHLGAFHLVRDERMVVFRLLTPIRPEADLRKQFGEAFGAALGTLDEYLQPLALLLCSTAEAQTTVASLTSGKHGIATPRALPDARLELN